MVQVQVSEGILEGEFVANEYGGSFYSFKGIPYATPPIGDLKFKAPQPPKAWKGIRSAKEFGQVCFQSFTPDAVPFGSEDCLYLNVYTPNIKPSSPLPVMFWIHGGGFIVGSGNDDLYGPEFLVKHGVILVTFNYRLGALGFLCLDTEDIPGNAGMKDQVAALRWVKNNIGYFGGDPNNITVFGQSAGGICVSYFLISPMTKGLFQRAIVMSGAITCFWGISVQPREKALFLAKKLGCDSQDDQVLVDFFKSQPLENFVKLYFPVENSRKPYDMVFSVVSEKQFGNNEMFFYGDPIDALRYNAHEGVDVIHGYTKDEGYLLLKIPNCDIEILRNLAKTKLEFFTPTVIATFCSLNKQLQVARKVKEYYFNNEEFTAEMDDKLLDFLKWDMFNHGVVLQAEILAKSGKTNIYFYRFCCRSERNFMIRFLGVVDYVGDKDVVCHGDELGYFFASKIVESMNPKLDMNSETFATIDTVTKLWTNYAKYGKPTPNKDLNVEWTPYTVDEQNYLNIGKEIAQANIPDEESKLFWENLFKEFLPHWTA